MKRLFISLLLTVPCAFAQQHEQDAATSMAAAAHTTMLEHGGMLNYLLMGERFERQNGDGDNNWLWEAQGWYGGDYRKLWVKTEGVYADAASAIEHSEVQLLFSAAVAPFWDVQVGVRHDEGAAQSRSYAVAGLMGLAPYWFEIDTAAFVSDEGDVSVRLEVEYELRLTQKLLLQPRLELNHAFASNTPAGIDRGLFDSSVGLRLRYEFIREFAPYIGVEWNVDNSDSQDDNRIVAGVRFWY